jgi:molybdopterin synthase sulfur carrier subunit
MALKLVFLGRLEDAAGAAEMTAAVATSIDQVLAGLESGLAAVLSADKVRVAVNGTLVSDRASVVLQDDDEVAFLPPVSGG